MNVFYTASTNYHILECIIHKIVKHRNDYAVISIPCYHRDLEKIRVNLINSNIFDDVIVINDYDWSLCIDNDEFQIDSDIISISNFFEKNNKDIVFSDYDELNICCDHNTIGVYLVYNKILYNYFEDGCGVLSEPSRLMNQFKNTHFHRYNILKKLGIPGDNPFVVGRYGDFEAQIDSYIYRDNDIDFSVKEELSKLDFNTVKKIIGIFVGDVDLNIPQNSDLLLA